MNGGQPTGTVLVILTLFGPLGARDLTADEQLDLVGSRVRLQTIGSTWALVGTVVDADAKSLVVESSREGTTIRVSRDDLLAVESSRGFRRRTLEGLVGGALVWGVIVGLFAAFDTLDESGVGEPLFIGGLLVAGGAVGSLIKSERWERVPLQRVTLRLSPTGRGAQVQVVLAF